MNDPNSNTDLVLFEDSYISQGAINPLNCPGALDGTQAPNNKFGTSNKTQKSQKNSKKKYNSFGTLGLPDYASSPKNIYEVLPDPNIAGAPLPRPYGPRDNARMQNPDYTVHGFGGSQNKFGGSNYKFGSTNFGGSQNKFGVTPGTPAWNSTHQNYWGQQYAVPDAHKDAKGLIRNDVPLLVPTSVPVNALNPDNYFNAPMQYKDNALNTPLYNNYSKRVLKKTSKKTKKIILKAPKKSKKTSKKKPKSKFGKISSSGTLYGPNNVGHETHIPIYKGGGNTKDFLTGSVYENDYVPSPVNSTGYFAT